MIEPTEQRRLSAIMFTDIAGYSALTQKNEVLALELLHSHFQLVRSLLPKFHANEIKTIGDAFLLEFFSAFEAVDCGIAIQRAFNERNENEPAERKLLLRIGIHLGDVVHRDNDVFGDGVNIAARIEPFAIPGGICLSEDIVRLVQNKIDYPLHPLTERQLKNITLPVRLFALHLPWNNHVLPATQEHAVAARPLQATTIAVLPFSNIGGGNDDFFSEGITEEIISSLSKISGIDVIARTSAFKFRDSAMDLTSIAEQLGAGNILGGSVRRVGEKARISIRMTDAATQKVIWSDDFTKELNDILTVQSDIAMNVASSLKVKFLAGEKENVQRRLAANSDSYQEYLLGRFQLNKRVGESIHRAIEHFNRSIAFDKGNASAYAGLAEAFTLTGVAGYGSLNREEAVSRALHNSHTAIVLDESLAEAHLSRAYVKFRIEWNWEEAERGFLRAIELKPGLAKAHELFALFLAIHRRFDESIRHIERARDLDPLSASVNTGYGRFLCFADRWDEGFRQLRYTTAIEPNHAEAHFGLTDYYLYNKNYEEALASAENALSLSGRRPIILSTLGYIKAKLGDRRGAEEILKELQQMTSSTNLTKFAQSNVMLSLGKMDDALRALEDAVAERDGMVIYINMNPAFYGGDEIVEKIKPILTSIGFR